MSINENLEIKDFLNTKNISLFGVASISYSKDNSNHLCQNLLKYGKSIICYAIPIPKGIIYSDSESNLLYWRYCNMSYRFLDEVANSLSLYLENMGFPSTPIYACYPWKVINREFWGLVSLVKWAEVTGIGKITKCGLLGHPKHGTRILLGGVITAKILHQSKKIEENICPTECTICIDSCPANAISPSGKVDHNLCIRYSSKNPLIALIIKEKELKKEYNFQEIINCVGIDDHGTYECFECLKKCILNNK